MKTYRNISITSFHLGVSSVNEMRLYISLWFSVKYAVHLYGYLKEWRKNPQWSFSCCLALILPLIDLPEDISGLAGTNVLNTQLDTGHMELTTIVDAVKDSGAIDVTVEEEEQGDGNPAEVQEGNFYDPHLQTGETKDGRMIDVILTDGERHGNNPVEVQGDNCNKDPYINTKCHQGTQTELSTISSIADVVVHEPEKATHF